MAYALLGIPSIIFGLLMFREKSPLKAAGALLALNGVACILGIIGFLARSAPLSLGTLAGGVLFLLALVPMSLTVFKEVV